MAGGVLHLRGGDGADAVGPTQHVVDRFTGGERRAVPARHGRLIVLRVDRIRDQAGLGTLQFLGGDALGDRLRDHLVNGGFQLRQRRARRRDAINAEFRHVERGTVVGGAGGHGDMLVHHQSAVEQAVGTGAEDMREHVQ